MIDSITKKDFSEQISGALTGLGILGTFIGLSIGLAKFNLGKNMDTNEMQTSISSLMNGIRAAFYTSIFGVGFSIVTNFFIILISIPPPSAGGTNSDESVPILYTVF
jgi:hypothetical protein